MAAPLRLFDPTYLDQIAESLRDALTSLDEHERAFAKTVPPSSHSEQAMQDALSRLEGNLHEWKTMLDGVAEQVRVAQAELATQDGDLKKTLDALGLAKKSLEARRAA
jgi:chromosome segregation ATPase